MKICLVNNLYEPYNKGGSEEITKILINDLLKENHDVFLITTKPYLNKNNKKEKQADNAFKKYQLRSHYYNLDKMPYVFRLFYHLSGFFSFKKAKKIKEILIKEKPDLIIINNLMGLGYSIFKVINKLNIKHVQILHDIQYLHPSGLMFFKKENIINTFQAKVYQFLCKKYCKNITLVISPSKWLLNLYKDKGFFSKTKSLVLLNPKEDKKKINANDNKKNNDLFIFFYIGQVEKHKGIDVLISAYKKAKEECANSELLIAGDGKELKYIEKLCKEDANIKILGKISSIEVETTMKESNCLIVPSLVYENSPTVIQEAIQNNLPVIASKLGGSVELLNNDNILLFTPNDAKDLKEKIIWAYRNEDKLKERMNSIKKNTKQLTAEKYLNKIRHNSITID